MTKNINSQETSKLIRQALKESFSGVKFSITSRNTSMGAYFSVKWMDGPTEKMVNSVVNVFINERFNYTADCHDLITVKFNGEDVIFGASAIETRRTHSIKLINQVGDSYTRQYGEITAENFSNYNKGMHKMLANRNAYLNPKNSALVASIQ